MKKWPAFLGGMLVGAFIAWVGVEVYTYNNPWRYIQFHQAIGEMDGKSIIVIGYNENLEDIRRGAGTVANNPFEAIENDRWNDIWTETFRSPEEAAEVALIVRSVINETWQKQKR